MAALIFLNKSIIDPSTGGEVDTVLINVDDIEDGYPRFFSFDITGSSEASFVTLGVDSNGVGVACHRDNIAAIIHDIQGSDLATVLSVYVRQGFLDLT